MIFGLVSVFLSVLLLLIGVAFITLFERAILALSQLRKGPNNTFFGGIIQPLLDGVKLLLKNSIYPSQSFSLLFLLGASWTLLVIIIVWLCLKGMPFHLSPALNVWFFILILGLGVYGIFLSGWSGISNYSFLGSVRGCVQSVSYEVSFSIVVFSFVLAFSHVYFLPWSSIIFWSGLPFWFISYIAETNRAPVDLAEGESELISGFNVEFNSFPLAFIFVGEYGIVLCFSWFSAVLLFEGSLLFSIGFIFLSLIIRSTLPRFRYDNLLSFCWTIILPASTLWIFICFIISSL